MNKEEFMWILQSALLKFEGKPEGEIRILSPQDSWANTGIKLCNYLNEK